MNTTQLLKLEETILSLSLEEKKELFDWMSQQLAQSYSAETEISVSYTHLRAHET